MKTILKKFATFLCAALVLCACSDDDYSEAHQSLMALIRQAESPVEESTEGIEEGDTAPGSKKALQARIDAAAATETTATDDKKPGSDSAGAESADEADEQPAGNDGNTADNAIREAIAAELVAGKSKTAIKQELAGKEIGGVKLTHRLISDYIEKITAEE